MLEPYPSSYKGRTLRHSIESKRSLVSIYDQCEIDVSQEQAILKKIDRTIDVVNKDAESMHLVYDKYVGQFEIYNAEVNNGQKAELGNFESF